MNPIDVSPVIVKEIILIVFILVNMIKKRKIEVFINKYCRQICVIAFCIGHKHISPPFFAPIDICINH